LASRRLALVAAGLFCGITGLHAETLRCQSMNGNLNCAGSSGVSCQTINGRTTCVSGKGGIVQSFHGYSYDEPDPGDADDWLPPPQDRQDPDYR
jgi:hypothetical protein